MPAIRHWSFAKLLIVSAAWIVVSITLLLALLYVWMLRVQSDVTAGSGGVGAVSVALVPEVFIIVSVLPVVALLIVWVLQRVVKRRAV